ncbi:MAG: universal stress protein [Halobacteriovoraceae bacterium]|jgi:hypothetical protein|nr:universal stress protein [Halobacteriovoraceae bacterium]
MKKVMVCVDLSDESIEFFKKSLKAVDWSGIDEVHFVHGFQKHIYADNFYFTTFPLETEFADIEKSVVDVMKTFEAEIYGDKKKPNIVNKCIISNTPKKAMSEYAKESNVDEMIIATRGHTGIEGLFASSFAEYMLRHAACNLRILR